MGGQRGIKKSHIWRQRQPIIVNEIWDQGNVKLCNQMCSKHLLLVGAQNTFSKKRQYDSEKSDKTERIWVRCNLGQVTTFQSLK